MTHIGIGGICRVTGDYNKVIKVIKSGIKDSERIMLLLLGYKNHSKADAL